MGTTPRPFKSGGYQQYQQEVANAGIIDIIDVEVDKDIDTLYDLVNGHLDSQNLSPTASLTYEQLNLSGKIKDTDIISLSGSKLTGTEYIQIAEMGVGGATRANAAVEESNGVIFSTAETGLTNLTWTSRGGVYIALARVYGRVGVSPTFPNVTVTYRLRQGTVPNNPTEGTILDEAASDFALPSALATLPTSLVFPLNVTLIAISSIQPASALLKLTAQHTGADPGSQPTSLHRHMAIWEPA